MSRTQARRPRRLLLRFLFLLIVVAVLGGAWFVPRAGRYLVHDDPLSKSDAIAVLAGTHAERWLEAVDLYREGWAPRIVLSKGLIDDAELILRKEGVRFPNNAELARDAMVQMKVPESAVIILPDVLDNTAQEAQAVHRKAVADHWRQVIVVTSKYHTRRTSFAFERELRGSGVTVVVRGTKYDSFDPDRWWTRRSDFRTVTSELQKLLAYRLGLGG
jgi:uncharacterized SAM-binding protein YcdF (DUF218 family)